MKGTPTDLRIRRPQQHERLVRELQDEGGFSLRAILLVAAGIGFQFSRRVAFTESGEPIRYDTLTTPTLSETLINMIAASVIADDPEIMDDSRIDERVRIFEEFANGGLEYIQEQINVRHQTATQVVTDVVTEALAGGDVAAAPSVEELLGGVSW